MKLIATIFALTLSFTASVNASTYGPLVDASDLSASLDKVNPTLLDIRNKGYDDSHVDGALWAPYKIFRGPKINPGELVDIEALEASLELLGLEYNDPIVIISEGDTNSDFGAAARVYWTLKSTGFKDLTILNGGRIAWKTAKLPMNNTVETATPSNLELSFDDKWFADTNDVASIVQDNSPGVLVDARLTEFYEGDKSHKAAKRPGTLPGAINQSYASFFEKDAAAISPIKDVNSLRSTLGLGGDEEVISFCNTGHWAATHWFALSELAGLENSKLYAASMVEYSNSDLPMENTPGIIKNILRQIGF